MNNHQSRSFSGMIFLCILHYYVDSEINIKLNTMKNHKTEQTARQKAKQKVEFKIHMIAYIVVNSLLAIINLTFTPGYLWFIWPLLGWGIGIVLHGES